MRDFNVPGRSAAMAANGMVATSHPQATLAGLDILRRGGNAVDAAIAAVAMQCVVEPESTGIGGDCFVLYSKKGALPIALSGSGRAPAAAHVEWYAERQIRELVAQTPHAATVPGCIDAWCEINREHGTMPLADLLEPAAKAAEDGFVVTPRVATDWDRARGKLQDPITAKLYLKNGQPPRAGDKMANPPLARTLRRIGNEGRQAFYEGAIARDIVNRLKELGGLHELDDFAAQRSEWVEPIHASYRGYDVYECPPSNQGMTALMILKTLEGYALSGDQFSQADRLHLLAEATKAAYHVRDTYICDPDFTPVDVDRFLSEEYAEQTRKQIRLDKALPPHYFDGPEHKDTIYMCVVDKDGNACSFINSLFSAFGTGIVAPESGVILHNRGSGFRTIPGHPNEIAPRKRPFHTLIPGMLVKDGRAVMPFGVMGGQYQAVGHATFLHGMLDRGMDPQQAAEAPRVFAYQGSLQTE
ncbi:MAG: gamma-glutamyltransferase, partial [Alphaproteobacteria bacterium]|nr:gamma-glutamyltransferase [Alphaproteobacteria bacterium]